VIYIWAVVLLLSEIRAIIYDLDVILHLVSACIISQVDEYHILNPLQHGFHKSKSCQKKSIEFIDDVSKNLETDKTERCLKLTAII
jgi:hypothetical protein